MTNFLLFLMLTINPIIQSQQLFVASESLFDDYEYKVYYQLINHLKPKK
jgi:hypothetical protein